MEALVPLLEFLARSTPENGDAERKPALLNNARKAFGTQVLTSEMNGLITGTGSTESAYYFVMGLSYYKGGEVKQDYQRSLSNFHEALRCGSTEAYFYLGKHYGEGTSGKHIHGALRIG